MDAFNSHRRFTVLVTRKGFVVRDLNTGRDFVTCTGQSLFHARGSADARAANLNGSKS